MVFKILLIILIPGSFVSGSKSKIYSSAGASSLSNGRKLGNCGFQAGICDGKAHDGPVGSAPHQTVPVGQLNGSKHKKDLKVYIMI